MLLFLPLVHCLMPCRRFLSKLFLLCQHGCLFHPDICCYLSLLCLMDTLVRLFLILPHNPADSFLAYFHSVSGCLIKHRDLNGVIQLSGNCSKYPLRCSFLPLIVINYLGHSSYSAGPPTLDQACHSK